MNTITELVNTNDYQFITLAKDRFIAPALKYFGQYCKEETEFLCGLLAEDGIVLDIGANIGTHTLAFARRCKNGEVWSFEPQKFLQQILCGNISLNGFTNVRAFHCALGRDMGEIGVPLIDFETADNYGGLDLRSYGGGAAENYDMTPVITLDSLQLEAVDMLKIDVDGMEEEVLRGAFQTVFRCKPLIYIEADRTEQRAGLIGFLGTLGYRIWQHEPTVVHDSAELARPVEASLDAKTKENVENFKTYKAINLICVPKESPVLADDVVQKYNLKPILM